MIEGIEFHNIVGNIFDDDVKGLYEQEQIQVNCPRCQERDSLSSPDGKFNLEINTEKEVFRCWKCDEPKFSGSLGYLIKKYGGLSYYNLYKSYSKIKDFDDDLFDEKEDEFVIVNELPKEFICFSDLDVKNRFHVEAYNYMKFDRKLPYEILIKYRIGFAIDGKYSGRIIVPSYDYNGDINYFITRAYRGQKPPYDNPKADKNIIIFNEGLINWDSTIHLVEGVFDMFSTPPNTIPLLGKVISDKIYFKLKEHKPNVIIILDPDAYRNSIEILEKLKLAYGQDSNRIKIVKLKGKYDIDEIRMNYGKAKVLELLYNATDINVDDHFIENKYKTSKYYK